MNINFTNDYLGNVIITEGITDYYFFKIMQQHTNLIDKDIKFLAGSGANQSSTLISLGISFSNDFLIFLDNDKAGKSAYKKYLKEFGDNLSNNLHIYQDQQTQFVLEDFLDEADQDRLFSITNSADIKRAFGFLFYDYKPQQKLFVDNLSAETLSKIKDTTDKIAEKFRPIPTQL